MPVHPALTTTAGAGPGPPTSPRCPCSIKVPSFCIGRAFLPWIIRTMYGPQPEEKAACSLHVDSEAPGGPTHGWCRPRSTHQHTHCKVPSFCIGRAFLPWIIRTRYGPQPEEKAARSLHVEAPGPGRAGRPTVGAGPSPPTSTRCKVPSFCIVRAILPWIIRTRYGPQPKEKAACSLHVEAPGGPTPLECVGTLSPTARPCRRHRPTSSRWDRPAGMSDGRPDRPIVYPSCQSLLGSERWMWRYVLLVGYSQLLPASQVSLPQP